MKVIAGIKMYTASEVGEQIGVSLSNVYRQIKSGKMRATKIGRSYMISEENFKNFLNGKK